MFVVVSATLHSPFRINQNYSVRFAKVNKCIALLSIFYPKAFGKSPSTHPSICPICSRSSVILTRASLISTSCVASSDPTGLETEGHGCITTRGCFTLLTAIQKLYTNANWHTPTKRKMNSNTKGQ